MPRRASKGRGTTPVRRKGERRRVASFHQSRFTLHMPARSWLAKAPLSEAGAGLIGSRVDCM